MLKENKKQRCLERLNKLIDEMVPGTAKHKTDKPAKKQQKLQKAS